MQCPRCKMDDVYLSSSKNSILSSLLTKSVRCHRCCYLFKVPCWKHVPRKPADPQQTALDPNRRVA